MEPHSGERRPAGTVSSTKTTPKSVCRGLGDLSTIFHGSTEACHIASTSMRVEAEALGCSRTSAEMACPD